MNFTPDDVQLQLVEGVSRALATSWPLTEARARIDEHRSDATERLWKTITDLGLPGLMVAPEKGGGGADLVTAALVHEALGAGMAPRRLRATVTAGHLLSELTEGPQRSQLLERVATGEPLGIGLEATRGTHMRASRSGDVLELHGSTPLLFGTGAETSALIVVRLDGDASAVVLIQPEDGLVTPRRTFDGDVAAQVSTASESVRLPTDRIVAAGADVDVARRRTLAAHRCLVASTLVGQSRACLDMTVAYVQVREQFGKPIGSYQAVSHPLADLAMVVDLQASLSRGAALEVDDEEADALSHAAYAWAGDGAVSAAETCLQLHGGIGFTWEHDIHLYVRATRTDRVALGTPENSRRQILERLPDLLADNRRPEQKISA